MRLLVIGGTRFVGWHLAEAAVRQGHAVTLFNRGRSPETPAGVASLRGDRRADLSALDRGEWDAVVDTCAYLPREVTSLAHALRGRVGHHLLVSTISVYAGFAQANDEGSPLATLADPTIEHVDASTYGGLKVLCECALADAASAARRTIVRPGLVVGPRDPTQRFTYWPARAARADDDPVLLPGTPGDPLQWVDARDLAEFMLALLSSGTSGIFNAVSTPGSLTMGQLWEACVAAAGRPKPVRWLPATALEHQGLQPWKDLPAWLPPTGETAGFAAVSNDAARAAGLRQRSVDRTVADTLAWWRALPPAAQAFTQAGLDPEREAAALRLA